MIILPEQVTFGPCKFDKAYFPQLIGLNLIDTEYLLREIV